MTMTTAPKVPQTTTLLLCLNSSQPSLELALYELGAVGISPICLAVRSLAEHSQRYHSAVLMHELTRLFQDAKRSLADLNALAVHAGPGSFTGIRTGLITARVMGQFLPIQTYAFNAFELAMGAYRLENLELETLKTGNFKQQNIPVHIALDARRQRAYYAVGHWSEKEQSDGQFDYAVLPQLLPLMAISPMTTPDNQTTAAAIIICAESLSEALRPEWTLEKLHQKHPSTLVMAAWVSKAPALFLRPWQQLIPLYLEEPNITLPKKNPALLDALKSLK